MEPAEKSPFTTCPQCNSPEVQVKTTDGVRGSIKESGMPRVYSKGSLYDVTCDACGFHQVFPSASLNDYSTTQPD